MSTRDMSEYTGCRLVTSTGRTYCTDCMGPALHTGLAVKDSGVPLQGHMPQEVELKITEKPCQIRHCHNYVKQ